MRNHFIFGDVNTLDYGIHLFDINTDESPESLAEEISIPGRNGNLLLQNYRFENMEHRYMGVIYENAAENMKWFRNAMLKNTDYQRLEDSIHPEEYYVARYIGGLEPKLTPDRQMVKFAIEFSRKPQRFLKSGEDEITLTSGQGIENPTMFKAKPLITVYGSGTLNVGSMTITIASHSHPFINIDCDAMDANYAGYNHNPDITLSNNEFPTLNPGVTAISWSGGISSVHIKPRWWII